MTSSGIRIERELRDDEDGPGDLLDAAVHFAFGIIEDTKARHFGGELFGLLFCIATSDAQ